jgi:hypothetical protein
MFYGLIGTLQLISNSRRSAKIRLDPIHEDEEIRRMQQYTMDSTSGDAGALQCEMECAEDEYESSSIYGYRSRLSRNPLISLEKVAFLSKPKSSYHRSSSSSDGTRKMFVHRYLTHEAIVNRLMFLAMVALTTIFIICSINGGFLNNVEWLYKNLLGHSYAFASLAENMLLAIPDVHKVANLYAMNLTRKESGRQMPFLWPPGMIQNNGVVLLLGSSTSTTKEQAYSFLDECMKPVFISMGWNLTAVSAYNDSWYSRDYNAPQVSWKVLPLLARSEPLKEDRHRYLERVFFILLQDFGVHILYIDLDIVQKKRQSTTDWNVNQHTLMNSLLKVLRAPYSWPYVPIDVGLILENLYSPPTSITATIGLIPSGLRSRSGTRSGDVYHKGTNRNLLSTSTPKATSVLPVMTSTSLVQTPLQTPLPISLPLTTDSISIPPSTAALPALISPPVLQPAVVQHSPKSQSAPGKTFSDAFFTDYHYRMACLNRQAIMDATGVLLWNTEKTLAWVNTAYHLRMSAESPGNQNHHQSISVNQRSDMSSMQYLNTALFTLQTACKEVDICTDMDKCGLIDSGTIKTGLENGGVVDRLNMSNTLDYTADLMNADTFYFTVI